MLISGRSFVLFLSGYYLRQYWVTTLCCGPDFAGLYLRSPDYNDGLLLFSFRNFSLCCCCVSIWGLSDWLIRLYFRYFRLRMIFAILRFSANSFGTTRFNVVYARSLRCFNETGLDLFRGALQFLWKWPPFPQLKHLGSSSCPFSLKTCFTISFKLYKRHSFSSTGSTFRTSSICGLQIDKADSWTSAKSTVLVPWDTILGYDLHRIYAVTPPLVHYSCFYGWLVWSLILLKKLLLAFFLLFIHYLFRIQPEVFGFWF